MSVKNWFKKHAPDILMFAGIAGNTAAIVLAVKATPKAMDILKQKKEELGVEELDIPTTIKTAYKPYIPAAITSGVSTGLLIASGKMHLDREIAATVTTQIAMSALDDYKAKAIDIVGKEKAEEIQKAANQSLVDRSTSNPIGYWAPYAGGNTLCIDSLTGQKFFCDISIIKDAERDTNDQMRNEGYCSLNDFYCNLGLDPIYPFGDIYGWRWDWANGGLKLSYSSCLIDNFKPCLVINYETMPRTNYDL